jgi:trehalose 6-phosphate phosphatase
VPEQTGATRRGVDWSPWLLRPGTAGALTDYDGTLARIVADRERAEPLPGARGVLSALANRLALVAVVSGRQVEYLRRQLGAGPRLLLVGLYGLERSKGDKRTVSEHALPWQEVVAACARSAEREAPEGVEVEFKGLAVVLHVRGHPELLPWVMKWSERRAGETGLIFQPGRSSVELLPPVGADKGTVVEELASGLDAVCFFGDDTGDLPAFAALRRLRAAGTATVGVGVQSTEEPEALTGSVDLLVDGPEEAVALLGTLTNSNSPFDRGSSSNGPG